MAKSEQKIRPLYDNILIRRDKAPDMTPGGVALPENTHKEHDRGAVIAVGAGWKGQDGKFNTPQPKAGDHVIFRNSSLNVVIDDLVLVREADVLAVLE